MQKLVASLMLFSVLTMIGGPALATAQVVVVGSGTVTTGLTKGSGGVAPIVKAKWEMNGPYAAVLASTATTAGTDDYPAVGGAQFDPKLLYGTAGDKTISVCGVIYDASLTDINAVYGDVYYPEGIAVGANHPADRQGCGTRVGSECTMVKIGATDATEKTNSWDLFCNKVRNNNTGSLPTFAGSESFDTICSSDGWIKKDVAYVYCCDKNLSYEDPSGLYSVDVWAASNSNATSDKLNNKFTYNDGTAFQVDFANVAYGAATVGNWITAPGNITFAVGDGRPTIRNVGNTRLAMEVAQDDMGMGDRDLTTTTKSWNVHYKAKVNTDGSYRTYDPFAKYTTVAVNPVSGDTDSDVTTDGQYKVLVNDIGLSVDDEIDFGVLVDKFETAGPFSGRMWLKGVKSPHSTVCPNVNG